MKAICLSLFILICLCFTSFGAESDWFVVLDATNGFYASPGVPDAATAALKEAQNENAEIKSIAFTPTGDWLLLTDKNFRASDVGLEMCKKLPEIYHNKEPVNCVAVTPSGGWTICTHGVWGPGNVPSAAWKEFDKLGRSGKWLRSISYGPNESWVVLYGETGVSHGGIEGELTNVLDHAANNNIRIQCVAFTGTNWICLADNDWWASDTNLPAARIIDQEYKSRQHPKWVAFVPNLGPFNARKFGTIIRQTMAGKLAGGYQCVVVDHGKVVVALADGWARAPWEKADPAVKMTVNMPIALASVSKTITAVAILRLCEECAGTSRQFSLDEPFWPHLSGIFPDANEDVKKITIRQLLRHQSGFTNDFGDNTAAIKKLLASSPPHPPGTFSKYLNAHYGIINLLIEQLSGMDCPNYVKTHVLAPMGITDMDTVYHDQPAMCVYAKLGNQDFGDGYYHIKNAAYSGINGWYGSAVDLERFLEGIRQNRVLTQATTKMMLQQNLGWDFGNPWYKGGMAPGPNGRVIHTDIYYFTDDVEAVILLNCEEPPHLGALPIKAWKEARY